METADLDGLESLGEELQQEIDSDVYVLAFVALRLVCGDFAVICIKLDRVGPVDNRPSTDKLHYFVKKKKKK